MARPTTKKELIDAAVVSWDTMWKLIHSMPEEQRHAAFLFGDDPKRKEAHWKRDQNLRDILVHLYEWHMLLLNWVTLNMAGKSAPFLPEPFNWKTYGDMNVMFWEKHQSTPYEDAKVNVFSSHDKVMELIQTFTEEELFTKKHFSWTGTTTLGSYCISVVASHYDWAIKKLKLHIKTYQSG